MHAKIDLYLLVHFVDSEIPETLLSPLALRSIASVTRRTGLDRKNETGRFTEFRDSAENGKLIILSREGRSNESFDRVPLACHPPFTLSCDVSQSLPHL